MTKKNPRMSYLPSFAVRMSHQDQMAFCFFRVRGPWSPSLVVLVATSACGIDSLPDSSDADPREAVSDEARHGERPVVVRGSGGESTLGAGSRGDEDSWLPAVRLPVTYLCTNACAWYVEPTDSGFSQCVEDARGYAFCKGHNIDGVVPFCLFGHDGAGRCYPKGCEPGVFFEGDKCSDAEDAADYCAGLDAGYAPGTLALCPSTGNGPAPDPREPTLGRCERVYVECLSRAFETCGGDCESYAAVCKQRFIGCASGDVPCTDEVSSCQAIVETCREKPDIESLCVEVESLCDNLGERCGLD